MAISLAVSIASAQFAPPPQLPEASQRMRDGDYAGARPVLEAVVARTPQLPEAHNLLGVCLRELGDPAGSVAQFRLAIKLKPNYENAWLNLGSTLFGLHDETGAVSVFNELLHVDPQSIDGHLSLAKILLARGEESAAVQHLEKVIQLDPHNTFALANAGLIESRKGNLNAAAGFISRALAQDPNSTPLQLALVELDLKRGQTSEATILAEKIARDAALTDARKQTLAMLLLNSAKQQFRANKFKDSIGTLNAVRILRPEDAELHGLLGLAWYETGDVTKASDELQQAIRLEPPNPDRYFQLGLVYLKHHTPDLAELVFEHGLTQLPDSAWLWLGLGLSQHFGDDTTRAQQSVQKALAIDPGLVEGYVVLGDILEFDGRLAEASNVFHQAIEKKPDLYIGYYYCGKLALEAGDSQTQQALTFLSRAIELNPDFGEAHFEKGRALEQAGELQKAVAEYRTSLAKDGGLSQAHYRLALIYRKLGQTQMASNELALFQKTKLKEKDAVLQRLEYRIRQP